MITATKNGHTKNFSDYTWKLLGKNRNGWEQVSASVAENIAKKTELPDSGQKTIPTKQVVENEASKKVEEPAQTVQNELTIDLKAVFINAVKEASITKTQIKDFLDSKEITYKANDSLETLSGILFEQLGTIESLNTQFGL